MASTDTLILTRKNVADLLSLAECITAVEEAFRLYGEGKVQPPKILGVIHNGDRIPVGTGGGSPLRGDFSWGRRENTSRKG